MSELCAKFLLALDGLQYMTAANQRDAIACCSEQSSANLARDFSRSMLARSGFFPSHAPGGWDMSVKSSTRLQTCETL